MTEPPFGFGPPRNQGGGSGEPGGQGGAGESGDKGGQGGPGGTGGSAGSGGPPTSGGSGGAGGFGFGGPGFGGLGGSGGAGSGGAGSGGAGGAGPLGPLGDPQQFADALRQFADLMSYQGGLVNWDLAKDVARQTVASQGDPSVLDVDRRKVVEALRLADLWLEDATDFPTGLRNAEAWSKSEWVEATLPVWSKMCDPIAARAVDAMGGILSEDPTAGLDDDAPEMRAMFGALAGPGGIGEMMKRIGGMMVAGQAGIAVGSLAEDVVSSTEIGLPLGPEGTAALVPTGVAAFGEGLSVPADEVRLFLALREVAHHRLFAHVPWLRARLLGAVEDYARGIAPDTSVLRNMLEQIDPAGPEGLNVSLENLSMFQPENTEQQKAALVRLETALALVEGWVATVVAVAAQDRLPHANALAEAVRRRRAAGGPAERGFAAVVGLELRPRRLREAAAIWQGLTEARGTSGRDAVWGHPDLLPTADDFDDPDGFVRGREAFDISGLEEQMRDLEPSGDAPSGGAPSAGAPPADQPEQPDPPAPPEQPGSPEQDPPGS